MMIELVTSNSYSRLAEAPCLVVLSVARYSHDVDLI